MTEKRRYPDTKENRLHAVERLKFKPGSVVGWNREIHPRSAQDEFFIVEKVTPTGYLEAHPAFVPLKLRPQMRTMRMSPVHVDKLPRTVLKKEPTP